MTDPAAMQTPTQDDDTVADTAALLSRLSATLDFDEFGFRWLEIQCQTLGNVSAAVLLIRETDSNTFKPLAKYPLDARIDKLAEVAYDVIDEECGLLVQLEQSDRYAVAYPVHFDNALHGIVALEVSAGETAELQAVMGQLQWSVGWIALYYSQQKVAAIGGESVRSKHALAIFSRVQAQAEFDAACQSLVTALATELACDRVSIGFPGGLAVKVQSVSHTAQFGKNMGLMTAIGEAMSEAMVLGRDVILPQPDSAVTAPDHGRLMSEHGSQSVLSIPVFVGDRFRCVLTLEKNLPDKNTASDFDVETVEFVRAIGVLCSPTLEDRRLAQRSLLQVVRDKSREQLARLFGEGYLGRKLLATGLVLLLLFFFFATGSYRIAADTELEGVVQRVMAAPYSGYIAEERARAGDLVKAGDVVARLEDKELRLERQKWLSERSQYRHEYNKAFASEDRSEVNIKRARMQQASAQLALTEQKLQRSNIVAPFDGVIISGDLSQRLGGFVEQGEVLFEIAPLDRYRVILLVDDTRISDVSAGQHGELVLSSLPDESFEFVVSTVTPITRAKDGANLFRVEARLLQGSERLRPGMQGLGKIEVDERRLIGIWTRSFTEWLRLQLWKWLP